ncbi:MAG: CPBP family intramembrane glutamic endopeptidase [Gemmatimonadales bacterium]|nr:CPBP family intramembrane glutamic endopeptidase [Gemmatimonadales bacterium]MDZ4390304.1 CPBP family intramembrane glutamic endopeptidase [Gemmatimonadales bacterium]
MDTVFYTLGYFAIALSGFLVFRPFDKQLAYRFGLLFVCYLVVDDFITGLPYAIDLFDLNPARWNWAGKVYSLLFSAGVIVAFGMNTKATGLILPQRNVKTGAIALIPLILMGVVLALMVQPSPPSGETIAFQLLMPGLAEELTFRGIAPALLLGLVRNRNPPDRTPWIVICIAAIPFGAVHGLSYSDGAFSFALGQSLWTASGGIIYGWLRFSTGSLLYPLLAHSFTNLAFHLTPLIHP